MLIQFKAVYTISQYNMLCLHIQLALAYLISLTHFCARFLVRVIPSVENSGMLINLSLFLPSVAAFA